MATSKLLKPTNVTISIPAFTDQPDQRVNSNCIDKEADAINSLSDQIASKRVTRIGNQVVGTTETDVNLTESIDNFDLIIVGEVQLSTTQGRFSYPPMIITPNFLKLSDVSYNNIIETGVYFYYKADNKIAAKGNFAGAVFQVYGVKL